MSRMIFAPFCPQFCPTVMRGCFRSPVDLRSLARFPRPSGEGVFEVPRLGGALAIFSSPSFTQGFDPFFMAYGDSSQSSISFDGCFLTSRDRDVWTSDDRGCPLASAPIGAIDGRRCWPFLLLSFRRLGPVGFSPLRSPSSRSSFRRISLLRSTGPSGLSHSLRWAWARLRRLIDSRSYLVSVACSVGVVTYPRMTLQVCRAGHTQVCAQYPGTCFVS